MSAYLNTKQFDEGLKYGKKALPIFEDGRPNWFIFNEYWFLLQMHRHAYKEAFKVLRNVMEHPKFDSLDDTFKEKWILMKGFMIFVIESDWDNTLNLNNETKDYRLISVAKLMNQFPKGSQDKTGINVMVLFLRFLFLLNRRQYNELLDMYDNMRNYYYRYLYNKEYKQKTAIFFKMIFSVLQKDFDIESVQKATEDDYEQLTNTRLYYEGGYEDLEVLPYEEIWDWVLKQFEEKKTVLKEA